MVSEGVINAVAKLKDKGKTPVQIAEQLNLSVSAVLDAIDEIEKDYGEDTAEPEPEPEEVEGEIADITGAREESEPPKKRGRPKGWKPKDHIVDDNKMVVKTTKTKNTIIEILEDKICELAADLDALNRALEILKK